MDRNIEGNIATLLFLFGILISAKTLMILFPSIGLESVRKYIHIMVTNWWFILTYYFTTTSAALFGPFFFIVFNTLGIIFDLWRLLGMSDRIRNYGLVYYPISLFILVFLEQFHFIPRYCAGIGYFCMGYGDGFAALIGKSFGRRKITGSRTFVGSGTMLIACVGVGIGFSISYDLNWTQTAVGIAKIVVIAIIATLLELMTPKGLDNLSVPLGTAGMVVIIEKIVSA
jgi:phytol kinase